MSEFAYLTFTLPADSRLHDPDHGTRLLLALATEAGGQFIRPKYLPRTDPRTATLNQPVANDAPTLAHFWADALADPWGGDRTYFAMRFAGEPHFYVDLHVEVPAPRHLFVLVNTTFFKRSAEAAERAERLWRVASILGRELHPLYGFGWVPLDAYPLGWQPSLTAPHTLHAWNYFGPAVVAGFGRDQLLRMPTWRTEPFPDGGMLLAMQADPFGALDDADAVAAQMGLALPPSANQEVRP